MNLESQPPPDSVAQVGSNPIDKATLAETAVPLIQQEQVKQDGDSRKQSRSKYQKLSLQTRFPETQEQSSSSSSSSSSESPLNDSSSISPPLNQQLTNQQKSNASQSQHKQQQQQQHQHKHSNVKRIRQVVNESTRSRAQSLMKGYSWYGGDSNSEGGGDSFIESRLKGFSNFSNSSNSNNNNNNNNNSYISNTNNNVGGILSPKKHGNANRRTSLRMSILQAGSLHGGNALSANPHLISQLNILNNSVAANKNNSPRNTVQFGFGFGNGSSTPTSRQQQQQSLWQSTSPLSQGYSQQQQQVQEKQRYPVQNFSIHKRVTLQQTLSQIKQSTDSSEDQPTQISNVVPFSQTIQQNHQQAPAAISVLRIRRKSCECTKCGGKLNARHTRTSGNGEDDSQFMPIQRKKYADITNRISKILATPIPFLAISSLGRTSYQGINNNNNSNLNNNNNNNNIYGSPNTPPMTPTKNNHRFSMSLTGISSGGGSLQQSAHAFAAKRKPTFYQLDLAFRSAAAAAASCAIATTTNASNGNGLSNFSSMTSLESMKELGTAGTEARFTSINSQQPSAQPTTVTITSTDAIDQERKRNSSMQIFEEADLSLSFESDKNQQESQQQLDSNLRQTSISTPSTANGQRSISSRHRHNNNQQETQQQSNIFMQTLLPAASWQQFSKVNRILQRSMEDKHTRKGSMQQSPHKGIVTTTNKNTSSTLVLSNGVGYNPHLLQTSRSGGFSTPISSNTSTAPAAFSSVPAISNLTLKRITPFLVGNGVAVAKPFEQIAASTPTKQQKQFSESTFHGALLSESLRQFRDRYLKSFGSSISLANKNNNNSVQQQQQYMQLSGSSTPTALQHSKVITTTTTSNDPLKAFGANSERGFTAKARKLSVFSSNESQQVESQNKKNAYLKVYLETQKCNNVEFINSPTSTKNSPRKQVTQSPQKQQQLSQQQQHQQQNKPLLLLRRNVSSNDISSFGYLSNSQKQVCGAYGCHQPLLIYTQPQRVGTPSQSLNQKEKQKNLDTAKSNSSTTKPFENPGQAPTTRVNKDSSEKQHRSDLKSNQNHSSSSSSSSSTNSNYLHHRYSQTLIAN